MTIDFYNQNAQKYFEDTVQVDMSELYDLFVSQVQEGGRILDVGCGSGRDSKAFLQMGFEVDAIDASIEMVRLANSYTGLNVKHQTFELFNEVNAYDGIWACASLLHVSERQLDQVLKRFSDALKPKGVWYMSFKYGNSERKKDNRIFTDLNADRLDYLLSKRPELECTRYWITVDKRPLRDERWVNLIVVKK